MKFILGENLFKFQTGYVGVRECKSFFKGDLVAVKVKDYPNVILQIYPYANPPARTRGITKNTKRVTLYKVVFTVYDFNLGAPFIDLPKVYPDLKEVIKLARKVHGRNGFMDYSWEPEQIIQNCTSLNNILEIETEDDVWECPGRCEEPDEYNLCNDGCKKSYLIPYIVDNKVVVKNIVYDGTI